VDLDRQGNSLFLDNNTVKSIIVSLTLYNTQGNGLFLGSGNIKLIVVSLTVDGSNTQGN